MHACIVGRTHRCCCMMIINFHAAQDDVSGLNNKKFRVDKAETSSFSHSLFLAQASTGPEAAFWQTDARLNFKVARFGQTARPFTRPLHAKTPVDNKTSYDTTQQRGRPPPPITCTRDTVVFVAPTPVLTFSPGSSPPASCQPTKPSVTKCVRCLHKPGNASSEQLRLTTTA